MIPQVRLVQTNARGLPMGMSNPRARHDDNLVATARAMYRAGMSTRQIAQQLGDMHHTTVFRWVSNQRRTPPAKVVARRVKTVQRIPNAAVNGDSPEGIRPPSTDFSNWDSTRDSVKPEMAPK